MASRTKGLKIDFTKRELTGTGVCRKMRVKNMIPVVLYGPEYKQGLAGTVSAKSIMAVANSEHRETSLIELAMPDGTVASALIRDVQRHPLTQQIRHIDFYQVLKGHKIKVEIPIHVINKEICQGVKEGGLLNLGVRLVMVAIQPSDIPDEIVVDAKALELGSEVFIKDLLLPEGADLLSDEDTIVLHVLQPRAASDEEEASEEPAEVEVVAKGKASKEAE